ncbi:MAG: hypothetical protein OEV33_04285, partial [Armatimonadota bacterium]|nr:hypothetical protein [Armatimonadota bacterium]
EVDRPQGMDMHIVGALAERAFAKWLGVPWKPKILKGRLVAQDDVEGIEVRSAVAPCPCGHPSGCLRLNKTGTKQEAIYVLVIRRGSWFEMAGWILGKDGWDPKYWGPHYFRKTKGWSQNCYGVPRENLDQNMDVVYQSFWSAWANRMGRAYGDPMHTPE